MANPIKVQDLYNFLHERLKLEWLAGRNGRDRELLEPSTFQDPLSKNKLFFSYNVLEF